MEIINALAAFLAFVAVIYLFFVASKCAKELKKVFFILAFGILISMSIHSFLEFLEAYGYLPMEFLMRLMPILVLIGSATVLIASYLLWNVLNKITRSPENPRRRRK